jgi:hypothetical protein
MDNRYTTDQQQVLADMARGGPSHLQETSALVRPGGGVSACAVVVKSRIDRNVYLVRAVIVNEAGTMPLEVGELMKATNLAESYLAQGTLASGVYAIMLRVGERNVFYAVP